jgi:hypothetical protein
MEGEGSRIIDALRGYLIYPARARIVSVRIIAKLSASILSPLHGGIWAGIQKVMLSIEFWYEVILNVSTGRTAPSLSADPKSSVCVSEDALYIDVVMIQDGLVMVSMYTIL